MGSMNPVESLCFIGSRALGALEFEPTTFLGKLQGIDREDALVLVKTAGVKKPEPSSMKWWPWFSSGRLLPRISGWMWPNWRPSGGRCGWMWPEAVQWAFQKRHAASAWSINMSSPLSVIAPRALAARKKAVSGGL